MSLELALYLGAAMILIGAVGVLPFMPEFEGPVPAKIAGIAWLALWAIPPLGKFWLWVLLR